MNDWKADLRILAAKMREQQKNKKGETHKGDTLENFRGKKGFNDVGIPLSPKAAKKQQRNRTSYSYPAALRRKNEQRKKDAEERWGIKKDVPAASSSKYADRHSNASSRWLSSPMHTYDDPPTKRKKIYTYYDGVHEHAAEPIRYIYDAPKQEPAYKAKVIKADGKIKFKNKLEEAIYNHPNYSKQKF